MRLIASLVALFLFLSTVESWAGFWLAGRWFVSSRYASVSLATVRQWLDRGIISRTTEWAKVFIQRNGKWLILTIGLSQIIPEVEKLRNTGAVCYNTTPNPGFDTVRCSIQRYGVICSTGGAEAYYSAVAEDERCIGVYGSVSAGFLYFWDESSNSWVRRPYRVPFPGRHYLGKRLYGNSYIDCYISVSVNVSPCPFSSTSATVPGYPPSQVDWNQRRQVPVRVFPRVEDFVRPDVISADPSLRWLRDEYERLSRDASIPTIPADLLGDLELPQVDWSISPDEAIDHTAERGSTREGTREGSREGDLDLSVPGLNTDLDMPAKRPFPVELINSLVQNHPLLRVLQGVSLDAGGGGSCVFGSQPFVIDMCNWQWVLNLMGSFLVPLAFLYGLLGGRND